jgi:hypothetical protein
VDGGLVLDVDSLTVVFVPRGAALHNPVIVRGPTSPGAICAAVERPTGSRERPHAVFTRAHADREIEPALESRGYRYLLSMPGMALLPSEWPAERATPPELEVRPVETLFVHTA